MCLAGRVGVVCLACGICLPFRVLVCLAASPISPNDLFSFNQVNMFRGFPVPNSPLGLVSVELRFSARAGGARGRFCGACGLRQTLLFVLARVLRWGPLGRFPPGRGNVAPWR